MRTFHQDLLDWYDHARRTLPWRAKAGAKSDPYKVWMSEIMLQQTTVATVKGYFETFTTRWPTVADLAKADEEEVLAAWAGLGYYARARNLIKCARIVYHDMGGVFPTTEKELKTLPGIGEYTAAAIAAIAFGKRAVVVDSNVERIIARVFTVDTPLPKGKKDITAFTDTVTPEARAGDFAQAMMDLGASLCSPKAPDCNICPVNSHCKAFLIGNQESYPKKAPKKARPTRRAISYWIEAEGDVMVEKRPESGLLGGMIGLPHSPWVEQSLTAARENEPPVAGDWKPLRGIVKHSFTHFHLETEVWVLSLNKKPTTNQRWNTIEGIRDIGFPTVFKKMVLHALKHK